MNELAWPGPRSTSDGSYQVCEPPPVLIRQAVIMAGGKGTRLQPYSALFPKPLMPLGDMPILELLLRRMKAAGVRDVIIAVNHLRHLIEVYFGDGSDLGLHLHYSDEQKPLGTAGALGNMLPHLDETFFVTNGDLLTTMDLKRMALSHVAEHADASIGIYGAGKQDRLRTDRIRRREPAVRLSGEADQQILCQYGRLYSPTRGRTPSRVAGRLHGHAEPAAEDQGH